MAAQKRNAYVPPFNLFDITYNSTTTIYAIILSQRNRLILFIMRDQALVAKRLDVVWTPERKYITYICPTTDGKERRVRDIKLKQREEEAERQRKEQEILATWFLREEYINAGWFKRFLLRLEFAFRHTRGESHIPQIPERIRKEIARCLCPILLLTLNPSKGRESLPNGNHNKKPRKSKRARSRDLPPKRRQTEQLIVKNKSEPISIYEIVRICYVW